MKQFFEEKTNLVFFSNESNTKLLKMYFNHKIPFPPNNFQVYNQTLIRECRCDVVDESP